jgi:hypothetical protein
MRPLLGIVAVVVGAALVVAAVYMLVTAVL